MANKFFMMKVYIYLVVLFLCSVLASAAVYFVDKDNPFTYIYNNYCFQEQATTASDCGGLDTGNYSQYPIDSFFYDTAQVHDSNYLTGQYANYRHSFILNITYIKPSYATNNTVWLVKDTGGTYNLTIPQICYDQTNITFRVYGIGSALGCSNYCNAINYSCYNGSHFITLRSYNSGLGGGMVSNYAYEEAIYWAGYANDVYLSVPKYVNLTNVNLSIKINAIKEECNGIYKQEFANISYSTCGILGNGTYTYTGVWQGDDAYTVDKCYDGDYETLCRSTEAAGENWIYVKYPLPTIKPIDVKLLYKTYSQYQNVTIPVTCWNYTNRTNLEILIQMLNPDNDVYLYCVNETEGYTHLAGDSVYKRFYEEAIYWNFTKVEKQFNIYAANGTNNIFNLINGSDNFTASLDTSFYNQYVYNCDCEGCYTSGDNCIIGHRFNTTLANVSFEINLTTYTVKAAQPYYMNYSSYYLYGINYTRNLSYTTFLVCDEVGLYSLDIYINNTFNNSQLVNCTEKASLKTKTGSYKAATEGNYSIAFYYNDTLASFFGNGTFMSDLYNPTISLNYTYLNSFVSPLASLGMICSDTRSPLITYLKQFNNDTYAYQNASPSYYLANDTNYIYGNNYYNAICSDFFGSNQSNLSFYVYTNQITLINERNNTLFNLDNCSSARVYFDDNSSYYDFKVEGKQKVNITNMNNTKLRVEIIYSDGSIIIRYLDTSLLEDIRVCANVEGTTHYEQLIISASEKPAILKNVFSNCYIAADYTRFAYQDTKLLKAYSINSLYYLYTFDEDNNQIILASLDGSIQTYINLDTLEFQAQTYDVSILTDAISFGKIDNTTISIRYKNLDNNNIGLAMEVTNMDSNEVVLDLDSEDFTDYNNFTLYLNYATLDNVNESTLFKVELEKTTAAGTTTITRYVGTAANNGILTNGMAFIMAVLFAVFGLTLASTKVTFGWFGIIVLLAGLITLSLATGAWYITFLQVILVISMVYIFIIMVQNNNTVVV